MQFQLSTLRSQELLKNSALCSLDVINCSATLVKSWRWYMPWWLWSSYHDMFESALSHCGSEIWQNKKQDKKLRSVVASDAATTSRSLNIISIAHSEYLAHLAPLSELRQYYSLRRCFLAIENYYVKIVVKGAKQEMRRSSNGSPFFCAVSPL